MKSWLVLPSLPSGNNRRIELAGNDIRSGIGIDNVFVYPSALNIDRFKDAFSHVLTVWPLVAGRFRSLDGGSFVIEMSDNGIPVTFTSNTELSRWALDSNVVRDSDKNELLAFLDVVRTTKIAHDYPDEPLFRLKITHIVRSDEWVMGTSWSHYLGDAATYASFLHAFARCYQQLEPLKTLPVFERCIWHDDEADRSFLSTMKYMSASTSPEQRLDMFKNEWKAYDQLNLHFSGDQLTNLRKLVPDSTVTTHDVLIAYIIMTLNTHCFSSGGQLILRNNVLINYRGVSDCIASSNLVGNCTMRVWSNDFDDPYSLSSIAKSIRDSIIHARDPQYLKHWLATANTLIKDMIHNHRTVIWARFANGTVVNSNYRYDWASLADFGHTNKCRFYTYWSKNLFFRIFRLNPTYDAVGWMGRDREGAEVSFRIEKDAKQKFLDAFQRDINTDFIHIKI